MARTIDELLGRTRKPRKTKAEKEREALIKRVIDRNIQGVQIPIMRMSEISKAAEAAATEEEMDAAVKAVVAVIRAN